MIIIDGEADRRRLKERFERMSEQVIEDAERELEVAVIKMENDAKAMAPVDTGRLRNSIGHRKIGYAEWEVGTKVDYARAVEFGTMRQRPQPYLRPAFDLNWKKLKEGLRKAIGGSM